MSITKIPILRRFWPYFEILNMLPLAMIRVIIPSLFGSVVVSERYSLDSIASIAWLTEDYEFINSPAAKFLFRLIRQNYCLIDLDADYNTICERRGWITEPKEFIELQRTYLAKMSKVLPMRQIRTAQYSITETQFQIQEIVLDWIFKHDKRMADKLLPLLNQSSNENTRQSAQLVESNVVQRRPLTILHLAHYYGGAGGVTTTLNEYARFSRHNHIVLTASDVAYQVSLGSSNLKVIRLRYRREGSYPRIRNFLLSLPTWLEERQLLRNLNYDMVVIHGTGSVSIPLPTMVAAIARFTLHDSFSRNLPMMFSTKQSSRPVVIFFHGLLSEQSHSVVTRDYYELWENILAREQDGSVYADAYMQRKFDHSSRKPSITWYSPVDASIFRPESRAEGFAVLQEHFGLKLQETVGDEPVVLFYGRPDLIKGFPLVRSLVSKPRNFWLMIVGPTGLGSTIDKTNKLLIIDHNFDNKMAPHFIALSTLVLNPVTINGISRTTIESMLCGKPVMMVSGYDRTPLVEGRDFIGIRSSDPVSIIKQVEEVISEDDFRNQVASNGKSIATTLFNMKAEGNRLDSFLETIAHLNRTDRIGTFITTGEARTN